MTMRAISLHRPWPWFFFHGGKRLENRSWPPPKSIVGQWVAMHAALKFDDDALDSARRGKFGPAASMVETIPDKHPTGIVGAFLVRDFFPYDAKNDDFMPYAFGPWCWVTSRVVELPEPIPCKGRQGLWTLDEDAESIVRAAIERRAA